MIFIDSNVPMYLVGAPHPHKTDAQMLLERAVLDREKLVTDAEVLQEILHRYATIDRRDAIQPAFDALLGIVDAVLPITLEDLEAAKSLILSPLRISSRDALHAAVMRRHGIDTILSFDRGFDEIDGLTRLHR